MPNSNYLNRELTRSAEEEFQAFRRGLERGFFKPEDLIRSLNEMPNPNYQKGVRFERAYANELRKVYGCDVSRTRGSKGKFDLISVTPDGLVTFIQCKSTSDPGEARRLEAAFRANPPYGYRPNAHYHQQLAIKVDRKKPITVTVS